MINHLIESIKQDIIGYNANIEINDTGIKMKKYNKSIWIDYFIFYKSSNIDYECYDTENHGVYFVFKKCHMDAEILSLKCIDAEYYYRE